MPQRTTSEKYYVDCSFSSPSPYTFVVAALLLLLITPFVLTKTPTDIFPAINIPVVSVIWSYTGLPADQIAQRLVYSEERALTTTVDNIEHIESTSL